MTKFLISVVGPTAIGKTALAIQLASYYNAEIISADSRQFFKEMTVGTAVPDEEELKAAKHHFIQNKSIKIPYSVGKFEKEAITKIKELHLKNDYVILVGGSGLYVNAITKGLDEFPEVKPDIREALNKDLKTKGLVPLQQQLKELDNVTYNNIAIDNPHRVIRALEVCISSGKPYSSFLKNTPTKRAFKTITVGLKAERELIYKRINQRVDVMINNGLVEEAKGLLPYKDYNALNTVGYKELFAYFNDECNLETAISEIKKNTRRFAKRQLTWFKKDKSILWFDSSENTDSILKAISNAQRISTKFETERLIMRPTKLDDAAFIFELMTTPKWLQYIGDRNIHTIEDAKNYISTKILTRVESFGYSNYTVIEKHTLNKIGTCGLYKRDNIEGFDIGFALLPHYEKLGYGYEAANKIKNLAVNTFGIKKLKGITTKDNIASQKLLIKLGMKYVGNTTLNNSSEELMLYQLE